MNHTSIPHVNEKRPAKVMGGKDDIVVPLTRPRTIESLTGEEAKSIERQIWRALLEEVGGVGANG